MAKKSRSGLWSSDWFFGLIISVAFLAMINMDWLQAIERTAYDFGVQLASRNPSDRIAVVAIDDESIENIGRWPWSRNVHAKMIDTLKQGGAKLIGYTVFFLEPQLDPGLDRIRDILSYYDRMPGYTKDSREVIALGTQLRSAARELDADVTLAGSLNRAGNVVLAMPYVLGQPAGRPDAPLPDYVRQHMLTNISGAVGESGMPLPAQAAFPPIPELGKRALAIGHLNSNLDVDGGIRSEPLLLSYYEHFVPSLSLQLAARSLNLEEKDIAVTIGSGIRLGGLAIPTDFSMQMNSFFYDSPEGRQAFAVDSFFDVFNGKIPASKYRDKIVLIGATATGIVTPQVTPVSPDMPPVVTLAHSLSSILNEDFFVRPEWARLVELAAMLLVALYLISLLPRLKAAIAAVASIVLLNLLIDSQLFLMAKHTMWLQLMAPAILLVFGHVALTTKRFLATERLKLRGDVESAETNKMLALAFQGQGQLDMALEKFRKCPLNDEIMGLMYNLGLDYERKRQFNKAVSVYNHMAEYDPDFRDIQKRTKRNETLEGTLVFGASGPNAMATMLSMDGEDVQKPMLGRYQVEKELGKGAMGVVYLGRDPKINRVVAIKTMALSQEFEADELQEVKERFFREAETAGRLNHPNIVTIYDAGEEQDLAYIAMEFLNGHDLSRYTKSGSLLPVPKVFSLVFKAAVALDYAHTNNVVHRDVKPANIMYDPDADSIKITDFGIARITDSSKTKTGTVLGTPSYMSPEQLAGKRVDGRTDLYSLGVLFYQMLTGRLPFEADSMASLMFKITNEPHPPIRELRAELPPCIAKIVDKALSKAPENRYQRGNQLAQDLKLCARQISSGGAPRSDSPE